MRVAALYDVHGDPAGARGGARRGRARERRRDRLRRRPRRRARSRAETLERSCARRPRQLRPRKLRPRARTTGRAWRRARRRARSPGLAALAADRRARRRPLLPRDAAERHATILTDASPARAVRRGARTASTRGSSSPVTRTCSSSREIRWVNAGCGRHGRTRTTSLRSGRSSSDDVELRRTPFDVERAARRDPRLRLARGEAFVAENIRAAAVASRGDRLLRDPTRDESRSGGSGSRTGSTALSSSSSASDDPERFADGASCSSAASRARSSSRSARGGRPVIRLDREVARGAELEVDRERRCRRPSADEYYVFQLVGLDVEEEGGATLGQRHRGRDRRRERRARARHRPRAAAGRGLRAGGRSRRRVESLFAGLRRPDS